jgi:phosphoribosylanthranilate isomerase
MIVKICGITNEQDALMAAEAGAGAIGFLFWEGSRRRIGEKEARKISEILPASVLKVGVFVDAPRKRIESVAQACHLDVLQLHGNESPAAVSGLPLKAWKALRVGPSFSAELETSPYLGLVAGILLDTRVAAFGGSGKAFDWELARPVRALAPFLILAGGLNPENVADANRAVRPDVLDVSTGVERSPGRKDRQKVHAFIAAVRGELS